MIDRIKRHKVLSQFVRDKCSENNVAAEVDSGVDSNDYVIVKPDDYYNSLRRKVPPSVDCLIIQRCVNGGYKITLVELKSITSMADQTIENLVGKFETVLTDFIPKKFKDLLHKDYKAVELYFVTEIELYRNKNRDIGLKLEALINKRFIYNQKRYMVQPRMPVPVIKSCY